jgi:hypothetical protein
MLLIVAIMLTPMVAGGITFYYSVKITEDS